MMRSKLAISWLVLALLGALPAAAERPSINSLNKELKRTKDAICAKADADGDTYRPFVCEPRCGCFSEELIATASSCEETEPGSFEIAFTSPATCSSGTCSSSSLLTCNPALGCLGGETCVTVCAFTICQSRCRSLCTIDGDCPPHTVGGILTGVGAVDSPDVAQCTSVTTGAEQPVPINSNDANECVDQVEAVAGPCQ